MTLSASKVMNTVFWDVPIIIQVDYFENGNTIDEGYYIIFLDSFYLSVKGKHQHLVKEISHQDRAHVYSCFVAVAKFHEFGIRIVSRSIMFARFSTQKLFPTPLFGSRNFALTMRSLLKKILIPKSWNDLICLGDSKGKSTWTKCIELNGDYVEK